MAPLENQDRLGLQDHLAMSGFPDNLERKVSLDPPGHADSLDHKGRVENRVLRVLWVLRDFAVPQVLRGSRDPREQRESPALQERPGRPALQGPQDYQERQARLDHVEFRGNLGRKERKEMVVRRAHRVLVANPDLLADLDSPENRE